MLQTNEYFSGTVKSIGYTNSSTGRATVGVMAEGEYNFGTAAPEEMTVVSGALNVLLPGEAEWKVYDAGDVGTVPGNSEYHLQVAELSQKRISPCRRDSMASSRCSPK
ncbi:pyrimidine/purine nucleoside phosphorylase, partial [Citrobacter portucalensis]